MIGTHVATTLEFQKIEMRVGRVVSVDEFPEARNPSYKLTIDLGSLGTRRSSVAVKRWYLREELMDRLVVCVTNFPPRRIAGFSSEVLVLGAVEADGRVVLLRPDGTAELGSRIA